MSMSAFASGSFFSVSLVPLPCLHLHDLKIVGWLGGIVTVLLLTHREVKKREWRVWGAGGPRSKNWPRWNERIKVYPRFCWHTSARGSQGGTVVQTSSCPCGPSFRVFPLRQPAPNSRPFVPIPSRNSHLQASREVPLRFRKQLSASCPLQSWIQPKFTEQPPLLGHWEQRCVKDTQCPWTLGPGLKRPINKQTAYCESTIKRASPPSRIKCLRIWGEADAVLIEIKCKINVMGLNHPEIIPLTTTPPSPWKNYLPQNWSLVPKNAGDCCPKGCWDWNSWTFSSLKRNATRHLSWARAYKGARFIKSSLKGDPKKRKVNVQRKALWQWWRAECVQGTERRPFLWSFVSKGENGLRRGFQKAWAGHVGPG